MTSQPVEGLFCSETESRNNCLEGRVITSPRVIDAGGNVQLVNAILTMVSVNICMEKNIQQIEELISELEEKLREKKKLEDHIERICREISPNKLETPII